MIRSDLRAAVAALACFTLITGVGYPLLVTGIAGLAFPVAARGSMITVGTQVRGSALVGQSFTRADYLWGRPSAIGIPYDARGSSGSNLGPGNPRLDTLVRERVAILRATGTPGTADVPVDLVTSSASGLDPHLSPAAALFQVRRIAAARHLDPAIVDSLIRSRIEARTFGILGEPRVNVLRVNLALDSLSSSSRPT